MGGEGQRNQLMRATGSTGIFFFFLKLKFSFNSEKMDESIRPVCDPIGDLVCRN